jgi:uncharacterized lipoprotein YajG
MKILAIFTLSVLIFSGCASKSGELQVSPCAQEASYEFVYMTHEKK